MARVAYSADPRLRWDNAIEQFVVEAVFIARWTRKGKDDVLVEIPVGAKSDLASIPQWALSFLGGKIGKHIQPAIVHDYLYRHAKEFGFTRAEVDLMFLHGMKSMGVGWFKRKVMYGAVRAGGWAAWQGRSPPEIT